MPKEENKKKAKYFINIPIVRNWRLGLNKMDKQSNTLVCLISVQLLISVHSGKSGLDIKRACTVMSSNKRA